MSLISCDLCLKIINTQEDYSLTCVQCDCLFCVVCGKKICKNLNITIEENEIKECYFCCSNSEHRIITEEEIINYCLLKLKLTRESVETKIKLSLKKNMPINPNNKIKIEISENQDSDSSFLENLSPQDNESESEYQEFTEISEDSDSESNN